MSYYYEEVLSRLLDIDLDTISVLLGNENAKKISYYGDCDHPNLEKRGDIIYLRKLIKKYENKEEPEQVIVTMYEHGHTKLENRGDAVLFRLSNQTARAYMVAIEAECPHCRAKISNESILKGLQGTGGHYCSNCGKNLDWTRAWSSELIKKMIEK